MTHDRPSPSPGKLLAAAAASALLTLAPLQNIPFLNGGDAFAAKGGGNTFLSASGDVNKDAESLLRWSLPISNKPVRELQSYLEAVVNDINGLKWAKMDNDLKRGTLIINTNTDTILESVPEELRAEAESNLNSVRDAIPDISTAIQEKKKTKIVKLTRDALRTLGKVEQAMVTSFPFEVPEEYSNLPQLLGRATVRLEVAKGDPDEKFDIEGVLSKSGTLTLVVDGYSAPVNGGAFVDLVNRGFYNGLEVIRSDGFIVQTGKPVDGDGFVDEDGKVRSVPLEVFAIGDKTPMYGLTLEDDGRGTVGTKLPFTSYGTLAMARREFEPNTGSSQFFWFLFEPDLTPAGRNLLDGSWSVFGYTTEGQKYLRGLQKGDVIVSAKVVDGLENLRSPKQAS